MNDHTRLEYIPGFSGELNAAENSRVLAVGDPESWRQACGRIPDYRDLSFCGIDEVAESTLHLIRPSLIVSPVVSATFDCLDLAVRLEDLRFRGAFRALARNLPRPEMICREVRGICPHLDFEIIPLPTGAIRAN